MTLSNKNENDWLGNCLGLPVTSYGLALVEKLSGNHAREKSSSETEGLLAETMRHFRAKVYFKC